MPGYEIPPQQKPANDNGYFEQLTKAVFQAGFSWKVINNKWPNFRRAFDGFDIDKVAKYDDLDVDRLLTDEGIVRNGRKIAATIKNAQAFHRVMAEAKEQELKPTRQNLSMMYQELKERTEQGQLQVWKPFRTRSLRGWLTRR